MEEVLVKSNMAYTIVGGTKFYDRKEIKDLLAYLRLIANNDDDLSLARIINEPKRNIGATSFERMAIYAIDQDRSILDALNEVDFMGIPARAVNSVIRFHGLINNLPKCRSFCLSQKLSSKCLIKQVIVQCLKMKRQLKRKVV